MSTSVTGAKDPDGVEDEREETAGGEKFVASALLGRRPASPRSRRFSEAESLVDVPVIDDIVVVCPGLVATVSAAHQRQLHHVLDLGGIDREVS